MSQSDLDHHATPRRRARAVLAALAILVLAGRPDHAAGDDEGQAAEPGLRLVQEQLKDGFVAGDAERLAGTLPQRMKTYVSWRPIDVGDGYYGAEQMRLFFRRMFRARQTVRFTIIEPALAPRPDGRAVVVAEWRYRDSGGAQSDARIAFTLGQEAGDWRVREIRDLK